MKLLFLSIFSLFHLETVMAQTDKISWEQGVIEAAGANAELNAAKSSLQSAQHLVKVSRSAFLPSITANAGYQYDSSNAPRNYSATINATENLFSGFSDSATMDRAKYASFSSEANLTSAKAKISFDLKSSFIGLLYSQKNILLAEDIIKRRTANLKLVQLRFESGRENIGSLNLSKAYLAQAKYDHLQAVHSLEIYQADLARVLGRDNYLELEVVGSVPTQAPPYENNRKINYRELVKEAPDYKNAFFSEQSAKASIEISKSNFYPELNLNQSVGRSGREYSSPSNVWSVGATLSFPLFNGGKDYYSTKSANEDYRASALNRKHTEESGITQLKTAYTRYIEAVVKLEVDDAFVLAASSRERIAKAQYNNGLITFTDWDTIENDLINRQKSLLQSQRERVVAEATWEQVQGRGVIP